MAIITKTTVGLLGELGDFRAAVISEANKNFLLDAILFNVKTDLNLAPTKKKAPGVLVIHDMEHQFLIRSKRRVNDLGHGFLKVGFHGDEYGKRQSIDPGLLLFGGAESFEAVARCLAESLEVRLVRPQTDAQDSSTKRHSTLPSSVGWSSRCA